MNRILILKNKIQEYEWGSKTFIPELTGAPSPSKNPQAEMWLGAHPSAPSIALLGDRQISLNELIRTDPKGTLSPSVAHRFNNDLPFLLKVLAVSGPLSIQAHPNREQARRGFEQENLEKIPLESPYRNYKDQNHKPELICALTQFWALKGFCRNEEIIDSMEKVGASSIGLEIDLLRNQPEGEGLKNFLISLLAMEKKRQGLVVDKIMTGLNDKGLLGIPFRWMKRLYNEYPGDIGVLSPLFLNVVELESSEAMYIASGEVHCYLEGAGLEIMASSDNVIRGGLTPKHIDVKGLVDILEFMPHEPKKILPMPIGNNEAVYPTVDDEFLLSVISLHGGGDGSIYHGHGQRSAEIIICTDGKARIESVPKGDILEISSGEALFIPASIEGYEIAGEATLYKATTPP